MHKKLAQQKSISYVISIVLSTFLATGLVISISILHALNLASACEWLIEISLNFLILSSIVSATGYLGKHIDNVWASFRKKRYKVEKDQSKKTSKILQADAIGLLLGIIAGISFSGVQIAQNIASDMARTFWVMGAGMMACFSMIANISNLAGLGNRIGRVINYFQKYANPGEKIWRGKQVNYILSIIAGIILGTVISAVTLAIVGITSAMTLGGALPIWASGGLFAVSLVSTCASACGYIGRCFDFILGRKTIASVINNKINKTNHKESLKNRITKENIVTLIGLSLGIVAAVTLLACGAATMPLFGLGLPKLLAGIIILSTCLSAGGGLGNRIGHSWDRFAESKVIEKSITLESDSDSSCNDNIKNNALSLSAFDKDYREETQDENFRCWRDNKSKDRIQLANSKHAFVQPSANVLQSSGQKPVHQKLTDRKRLCRIM